MKTKAKLVNLEVTEVEILRAISSMFLLELTSKSPEHLVGILSAAFELGLKADYKKLLKELSKPIDNLKVEVDGDTATINRASIYAYLLSGASGGITPMEVDPDNIGLAVDVVTDLIYNEAPCDDPDCQTCGSKQEGRPSCETLH